MDLLVLNTFRRNVSVYVSVIRLMLVGITAKCVLINTVLLLLLMTVALTVVFSMMEFHQVRTGP